MLHWVNIDMIEDAWKIIPALFPFTIEAKNQIHVVSASKSLLFLGRYSEISLLFQYLFVQYVLFQSFFGIIALKWALYHRFLQVELILNVILKFIEIILTTYVISWIETSFNCNLFESLKTLVILWSKPRSYNMTHIILQSLV